MRASQRGRATMDEKDKIIAVLAIGFLLLTAVVTIQLFVTFQRYGVSPAVSLTEFGVVDAQSCDGQVAVSYSLTNTGRDGFAEVEVVADGVVLFRNSYYLVRGETRPITVPMFLDDCMAHTFAAQITSTWT